MEEAFKTRQIQKQMLELLKQFHKLCADHKISYSLHGGTLLGAVREKGFIPWDDDADVSMGREEFEKFQNVLKDQNRSGNLKLSYQINQVPKVLFQEETEDPVWIDLFIYDTISASKICQNIRIGILVALSVFSKPKGALGVRKAIYRFPGWMRIPYNMLYLAGQLFPLSGRVKLANWFAKNGFSGDGRLIHRSNDQYLGIRQVFPASLLENYQMLPFEGTELMVFQDYRMVLKTSYGENYMTPVRYAQEEEQIHHAIRDILNQNKGGG